MELRANFLFRHQPLGGIFGARTLIEHRLHGVARKDPQRAGFAAVALCRRWCTRRMPRWAGRSRPDASVIRAGDGAGIMEDMLTTGYDGCGRCLVGIRRLSRS
jgi:hypothetical protein